MNSGVKTIVVIAVIIIVALGVITTVGSYFNYNNQEVALREQAEAQRGKVEGVHDAMWKIISQKAQVSQDYRTSFDSIYTHIIGGRYSQGDGTLMKWIKEANPNFDTSLYKDVMDAIEVQRTLFKPPVSCFFTGFFNRRYLCVGKGSFVCISPVIPSCYYLVISYYNAANGRFVHGVSLLCEPQCCPHVFFVFIHTLYILF